jgi:nucleoside-diphosphate-sugar epimerase
MRILLTGSEGYLGSVVTPLLMRHGHQVVGIDTGFYREGLLFGGESVLPETRLKDLRRIEQADLEGIDAVVHMGELSNDPTGQLMPRITRAINHEASVRLAGLARTAGAQRFVYMSSCSVYGVAEGEFVDETSPVNPQTEYAVCKTLVERDVGAMAANGFSPTFLRNATAYGTSPRMRFDIVLNNLAGLAWTTREIRMTSDGTPWRPLVHALDIGRAILEVLAAPVDAVHNQIFNVGDTHHNYRVREIAEIVAAVFPGCRLSFGPPSADNRSYRVSFDKIRSRLPGFACDWDARGGARQLHELFTRISMTPDQFSHRAFTRLKQLEYLLRTRQLDDELYWRPLS